MNDPLELTVMMYHYIRDPGDAAEAGSGILGMSTSAFDAQLDELAKQHIFVTWPEVRRVLEGKRKLPPSACLLTFDDGVCDHYLHVFPRLRDRKISGLFFIMDRQEGTGLTLAHKIHFLLAKLGLAALRQAIWEELDIHQRDRFLQAEKFYRRQYPRNSLDSRINVLKAVLQRNLSDEVDRVLSDLFEAQVGSEAETARSYYLTPEQMQEMSAGGMHFGGHSRSHPWFDWIKSQARESEIKASADWIRQFESGPWAFAYPFGGLSNDSPGLLRKYGFIAAFTTQMQVRHTDPYFIGRLDGEEMAYEGRSYA